MTDELLYIMSLVMFWGFFIPLMLTAWAVLFVLGYRAYKEIKLGEKND